jgi:hypothetical protein
MAAQPTVVVTGFLDITANEADPEKVDLLIEYRMLFVPNSTSLPSAAQSVLTVDGNFSKQDVRNAAHNAIVAQVAALGATISSARIFGVDDLV